MKKVLVLSLALILLLGITSHGTSSYFSDTETSAGNTFTAWVEEVICAKFNVSDKDNKIYKYDDSGSFVDSFDLSGGNGKPMGVATVGNDIYVLDQADKQVYQYTCSGTYVDVSKTLKKSNGSGLGNPDGLAIDGDDMWVVVWGPNFIIYHYSLLAAFPDDGDLPADLGIVPHVDNDAPTGLAIDSTYLYVLDYDTSQKETRFYRYPRGGGTGEPSKVLLDVSDGALDSPAGAMLDGTSLWVVDSGTNMMYEYDKDDLFDGSGTLNAKSEFPLDGDNDDATGV